MTGCSFFLIKKETMKGMFLLDKKETMKGVLLLSSYACSSAY